MNIGIFSEEVVYLAIYSHDLPEKKKKLIQRTAFGLQYRDDLQFLCNDHFEQHPKVLQSVSLTYYLSKKLYK